MDASPLAIRVALQQNVIRPGAKAAVLFRRWGGAAVTWEAVSSAAVAPGEMALVVPKPDPMAHTSLPPALGGPYAFGIGYILVRVDPTEEAGEPEVIAVAPSHRVLWLSGPFPTEAFAKAADDPRVSSEEKDKLIDDLGRLPVGLSLVKTERPSRSLVGYRSVDEVVTLDAGGSLPWPPSVF